MLLDKRDSGFLDCSVGTMFGKGSLIFPPILLNDTPFNAFNYPNLGHSKWFNSLSTGSLPIDGSSIRLPKKSRPGSCPLPTYIPDCQGDLGEIGEEFSHQCLFLSDSPPLEISQPIRDRPVKWAAPSADLKPLPH